MKELVKLRLKRKITIVLFMAVVALPVIGQQDITYYDAKWKPTVKDSASFYRPQVQKEGVFYRVKDYYISGQIQMNAVSKYVDKDYWEGKVTWYNEDGTPYQTGNYTNNRIDGEFITYLKDKRLVANYNKGYFISGKQNINSGSIKMYTEKESDQLKEIQYEKDFKGIRVEYYGSKEKPRETIKYFDAKGELIGVREAVPNGYFKGVEVFYNYNPMRVRDINYYPYGQLLISDRYYDNGKPRELSTSESKWTKTYYSEKGEQLAKIEYKLSSERLKPENGTELTFDYLNYKAVSSVVISSRTYEDGVLTKEKSFYKSGSLKTETTYQNKTKELQISYSENGEEQNRMVYKDYRPYNGTEVLKDRISTYKDGRLVEEVQFFYNTDIPQSKKTETKQTFFDKEGKVLGELELEYSNGYSKPMNGQRFTLDYKDGHVTQIEILKNGVVTNRTSYRKKMVGKDNYKTFRRIEEYDEKGYERTREMTFYSNGKLQADISFDNYKEVLGTFFDKTGNKIGTYDYKKEDGKMYKFFYDSDELELLEVKENGKLIKLKKYDYGPNLGYGQINPVLIKDIDIDCCATSYTKEGEVIGKLIYKDREPWNGQWYDETKRTLYTLKEGKKEGVYKKIDYALNVLEEGQYVNDMAEGIFKSYDYRGQLLKEEAYINDKLDGTSVYYDNLGKQIGSISFSKGKPLTGTKIISSYNNEINSETYKNGKLIEKIQNGASGKTVTKFIDEQKKQSISYYKNSDKKKLEYTSSNTYLDGKVIRYNKGGVVMGTAEFSKGNFDNGTVFLNGIDVGSGVNYVKVKRKENVISTTFYNEKDEEVFSATENTEFKGSPVFLNRLQVYVDYVSPARLY